MTDPVIRLHLFFACENDRAVILRQGPSKLFRMILWHRDTDRFEDGQWLKHKVYVDRCDLSPDGRHFLFVARDGRWGGMAEGSYTAISRPPYFTALSLFGQGDAWGGGGRFFDNAHFQADGGEDQIGRGEGLVRVWQGEPGKGCTTGLRRANGQPAAFEKPVRDWLLGRTARPGRQGNPLDRYDTQGGQLYRRTADGLDLIRDFRSMRFERIRAPYDWRDPAETGGAPWHPLGSE